MMIKTKLHKIMGERRMHLTELERLSGVSYATLHKMYHDKPGSGSVRLDTIDKICRALDVQPGDLFEYVPDSKH